MEDPKIGKYIEEKLNLGWTLDEIAGRSKRDPEAKNISRASVYNYIYAPKNILKN